MNIEDFNRDFVRAVGEVTSEVKREKERKQAGDAAEMPKVSVIMITYNQEKTIGAALDSVLAQKCDFKYEIELSDDCSTDRTAQICEEYARHYPDRIRFRRNLHNLGARDNYFDTLVRCRGKYVADLAGDDIWTDRTKLARQAAVLDAAPEVTLVHTAWKFLHDATGELSSPSFTGNEAWLQSEVDGRMLLKPLLCSKNAMAIHSCTAMFRKEVFDRAYADNRSLFRSSDYPCEDLQLLCEIASRGRVAYLPEVTLHYRVGHDSQLTSSVDPVKAFPFYLGTLRLRRHLQQHYGLVDPEIDANNSATAAYTATLAMASGDREALGRLRDEAARLGVKIPQRTRLRMWLFGLPLVRSLIVSRSRRGL